MRDFCLTAVVLGPKSANAVSVDLRGEVVSLLNRERTSLHIMRDSVIEKVLLVSLTMAEKGRRNSI
jgi:hypothetical protein